MDAAHLALGHLVDQAGLDQPFDVVVDPLRGLVRAGRATSVHDARLGELPQHLDALRLEQGLGLLDPLQVQDVSHGKNEFVYKI